MSIFDRLKAPFERKSSYMPGGSMIALSQLGTARWRLGHYEAQIREGFLQNPICYRAIRMVVECAASVAFRLEGEAAVTTKAQKLLKSPNGEESGSTFLEKLFLHLQLAGESYAEMRFLEDAPHAIFALRPDRVRPLLSSDGWISGYEYSQYGKRQAVRHIMRDGLGRSPVFALTLQHPLSDHEGQSPLEAAARSIDIHNAGAEWTKALMDNSARPSGALVYGKEGAHLSDQQFERLKTELMDSHAGAHNAGRPLLLEGGLEWKPMSLSPQEMDYLAARHAAAREIALSFGVPSMLLGIPGDNTYANYKEANLAFWRQTIIPLVQKVYSSLSLWLSDWLEDEVTIKPLWNEVSQLSAERDGLWEQVTKADFLSREEKRQVLGFEAEETA